MIIKKRSVMALFLSAGIGFGCLAEAEKSLAKFFVKNGLKAGVCGALVMGAWKKTPDSVKNFAKGLCTKQAAYKTLKWGSVGGAALFVGWKLRGSNNEKSLANLFGFGAGIVSAEALKTESAPEEIKNNPATRGVFGAFGGYWVKNVIATLFPPVNHPLGYDPHTSEITSHHEKPVILLSHGFGGSGKSIKKCTKVCYEGNYAPRSQFWGFEHTRENSISDEDIVTFDYPEAVSFSKANLGGELDTLAALWHLVECYNRGNKKIILVCHSRGCLAMINALHMLHFPNKKDQADWEKLKLWKKSKSDVKKGKSGNPDIEKIDKILRAIDRVFFINPLLDQKLATAFDQDVKGLGAIMQTLAAWFTNIKTPTKGFGVCPHSFEEDYVPFKQDDQTLPFNKFRELLKNFKPKKLTIMLAKPDQVVGNKLDDALTNLKDELKQTAGKVIESSTEILDQKKKELKNKRQAKQEKQENIEKLKTELKLLKENKQGLQEEKQKNIVSLKIEKQKLKNKIGELAKEKKELKQQLKELKLAPGEQLEVYSKPYPEDTNGHCSLEAGMRLFNKYWHELMKQEIKKQEIEEKK